MASRYDDYTTTYTPCFRSGNHDVSAQARANLRGLMQSEKRNMGKQSDKQSRQPIKNCIIKPILAM